MKQVYRILPFLLFIFIAPLSAQQMLEKQEAVQLVLENNFGVKIAKNSLEISENNQSLLNNLSVELEQALQSGESNESIEDKKEGEEEAT